MIICGCVCIPVAKHGMLELIPQTLFFFLERARVNMEGGSGYLRLSTLYVGLARAVSPTKTNFRLTFLLTRLQEPLYEDLAV